MILTDDEVKLLEAFFDEGWDCQASVGSNRNDGRSVPTTAKALTKKTFMSIVQSFMMNLPYQETTV